MHLTFNQLVIPLLILAVGSLLLLVFLIKLRQENQKKARAQYLVKLNPPAQGRNHRSLPNREYYLTQQMTKPTAEDELLLRQYRKLHPEKNKNSVATKK